MGKAKLEDTIVVFDDPISSLDSHRKESTRQHISRIANVAKQTIVLSHDPYYLRMIWNGCDQSVTRQFEITRSGKESDIIEWNCEEATRGAYFDNYHLLNKYLEEGPKSCDLLAVARCIRPLLEGNLRLRFPKSFKNGEWLGDYINHIRSATITNEIYGLQNLVDELTDINDFSKKYHHDQNLSLPPEDAELKPFVERTIKIIGGIFSA